ncbi:helicase [Brucepastera parasyntrophica]|uniref:helicase C-terminal domain-containing protein n=1 Tax=Brucepastera parasyntrophica TaxID=2880008 RepID=UPI00210C53B4|nr:helicase C-terminal domain-containing protein [Brucepastera parasyntrophica]ULQ59848.1 helicase [Brucepastera parasyntrophica]
MTEIEQKLSENVRNSIADAIKQASGNEVFMIGTCDSNGTVADIRIAARGHKHAVPVVKAAIGDSDVLIHNHPSGMLVPSDADLAIASNMAESGKGFYITNNTVTDLYVVVEPVLKREIKLLDSYEVSSFLDETGPLTELSENYEVRPSQIHMTASVAEALNNGHIGVFEAGTGVGKSFAYLLPAVLWAVNNNDKVVISTGTINLQQQLVEKDIPMAQKILGKQAKTVLMKGRQNYICRRRFAEALRDRELFDDELEDLEKLSDWLQTTADGSKTSLSFLPREQVWSRICSESDACMGMRCAFHENCFVIQLRKEAASASLLVVNHHLLFADLEARMMGAGYEDAVVLPPFRNIVFDEAHGMEDAATSFFSEDFTRFKINKQLSVLYRIRKAAVSGHLITLANMSSGDAELENAYSAVRDIRDTFEQAEISALEILGGDFSWRLSEKTAVIADRLLSRISELRTKISVLAGIVRTILEGIPEDLQNEPVVWETKFALRRLEMTGSLCQHFTEWTERPESVFWIEKKRLSQRGTQSVQGEMWYPRFVQTPLSVAPMMQEGVFEPFRSIVCTSATLRIAGRFDIWMQRTGVSRIEDDRVDSGVYESPFPYKTNVLLCIPENAPLPEENGFQDFIEKAIISLLESTGGHALVLFTSYESLNSACEASRRALAPLGISVLKQGDDDRSRLLESFKNDESSVLFATDSFWEGIDVPGETLSHVIIVKLPFSVPNDPVQQARSEAIAQKGGSPFMELSLPDAVIRFRQGFGRLIRRKTDRGIVTVLDRRIAAKRYGKIFLDSIPETIQFFAPLNEICRKIESFLYN